MYSHIGECKCVDNYALTIKLWVNLCVCKQLVLVNLLKIDIILYKKEIGKKILKCFELTGFHKVFRKYWVLQGNMCISFVICKYFNDNTFIVEQ